MPKSSTQSQAGKSSGATTAKKPSTAPPKSRALKPKPSGESNSKPKNGGGGKAPKERAPRAKPLPPPLEVEGLQSLPPSPSPLSHLDPTGAPGSNGSSTSSAEPTPETPLSAEAEQILAGIPASVGGEEAGAGAVDQPGSPDSASIQAMMAMVAFEEQDVREQMEEFFAWLADRFQSDHWRLTERQSRIMGRPTAKLLNSLWARLQQNLPDIVSRWLNDTPGAIDFLMACGIVLAPKIAKQYQLSTARKPAKPLNKPESAPASSRPVVERPAPTGSAIQWAVEEA